MSDLVKRLRGHDGWEAAARIEQLERELADARHDQTEWMAAIEQANRNGQQYAALQEELAAEKAMADRFAQGVLNFDAGFGLGTSKSALAAYRKARGL